MTESDFYRHCDESRIVLHEDLQIKERGVYIVFDDRAHIFIDPRLQGFERLLVAFHELAHFWLHPVKVKHYRGENTVAEAEAEVVATCAVIPRPIIEHVSPKRICDIYGFLPSLVEKRREILEQWRL